MERQGKKINRIKISRRAAKAQRITLNYRATRTLHILNSKIKKLEGNEQLRNHSSLSASPRLRERSFGGKYGY